MVRYPPVDILSSHSCSGLDFKCRQQTLAVRLKEPLNVLQQILFLQNKATCENTEKKITNTFRYPSTWVRTDSLSYQQWITECIDCPWRCTVGPFLFPAWTQGSTRPKSRHQSLVDSYLLGLQGTFITCTFQLSWLGCEKISHWSVQAVSD